MHIHQHAVAGFRRREYAIEHQMNRLNRAAGPGLGDSERRSRFVRNLEQRRGRLDSAREHDQGKLEPEQHSQTLQLFFGGHAVEEGNLGLAQDLDPGRNYAVAVSGQDEPRLLHPRMVEHPVLPLMACDQTNDCVQAGLGEKMCNGNSAFDTHARQADLSRRGGLGHGPIIRECLATVCPSGLDEHAVGVGGVERPEERLSLLGASKNARNPRESGQVLLGHGLRPHDADQYLHR